MNKNSDKKAEEKKTSKANAENKVSEKPMKKKTSPKPKAKKTNALKKTESSKENLLQKKTSKPKAKKSDKKTSEKKTEEAAKNLAAATAVKEEPTPVKEPEEKAAETSKVSKTAKVEEAEKAPVAETEVKKDSKEPAKTEIEMPVKVKAPKKEKESLPSMSFSKELKERVFSDNPVFVKFLAAIPILGAATTLKNGILISAVFVLTLLFLSMIMYPLERYIPKRFRLPAKILVAAILLTPQLMAASYFMPNVTGLCEFYLPLTALCTVPFIKNDYEGKKYGFGRTVLTSALDGAGFTFAALVFSMLREIIGAGMLYERPMPYGKDAKFPFVVYPAGAFILLGFIAALCRKIFSVKDKNKGEE